MAAWDLGTRSGISVPLSTLARPDLRYRDPYKSCLLLPPPASHLLTTSTSANFLPPPPSLLHLSSRSLNSLPIPPLFATVAVALALAVALHPSRQKYPCPLPFARRHFAVRASAPLLPRLSTSGPSSTCSSPAFADKPSCPQCRPPASPKPSHPTLSPARLDPSEHPREASRP